MESAIGSKVDLSVLDALLTATSSILPVAVFVVKQDGKIILANRGAGEMFGYRSQELIGQSVDLLVPKKFRDQHPGHRNSFFENPLPRKLGVGRELYGCRKEGQNFPIELALSPVNTDDGLAAIAVVVEITERKQLESRMEAALEGSPTAMVMIAENGSMVLLNAEAERLFGYPRNELMGKPIELLLPQRFRASHPEYRAAFFRDPQPRSMGSGRELYGLRKDGCEFPVEIGLSPVESGNEKFVLACIVDISQRVDHENQIRRLANIVQHSDDAIIAHALDGTVTDWNHGAENLFGYTASEMIGRSVSRLSCPGAHVDVMEMLDAIINQGKVNHVETVQIHKNGNIFPVSLMMSPAPDASGRLVGASTIARDISKRMQLERELQDVNVDLEQRVNDRTRELAQRNRDLEQFAYIASHDLQEPLRKVASCCQSLAEDYADQLDDDAREWIDFAVDGATRMRRLVNDLLEFSRIGTRPLSLVSVNANEACDRALESLSERIESSKIQVIRRSLPRVRADLMKLSQLFQNLIGNAIKYRSTVRAVVEIEAERVDDGWEFCVRDNGIGIASEHHERIFQIFQRLHREDEYEGTGIGLAICQRIVESFHGKIRVVSEVGEGSAFYFTLPAADD